MRADEPISVLATGAWLKNRACLIDGRGVQWSEPHGDLSDPAACAALQCSAQVLIAQAEPAVQVIAHDLHPDFYSTQLSLCLAERLNCHCIAVQHHHAHIAAVMAEFDLSQPVIGLALDGVGLGTDGSAWGGELLRVAPQGWSRLGHLWQLALPGGDAAARETWRMLAAVLHALGRGDEIGPRLAPLVGESLAGGVQQMLARGLNCPPTTSTGRWFDAAAAALGLNLRQQDEAQAAIALERLAQSGTPRLALAELDCTAPQLDLRPLIATLLAAGQSPADAAAWFHHSLAQALANWAMAAARDQGCTAVCLGGGCFMNRILTAALTQRLEHSGLRVYRPISQSSGDAGLAWGQAWVARHQVRASSAPVSESVSCV